MSGGNTQFTKNLRTHGAVALTTSWSIVESYNPLRSVSIIKNTSATEVVHISTNLQNAADPTQLPGAADTHFWPLAAGEVISFDKGIAPVIVFAKGATGAATVAVIAG